tara:strand:+ start:25485 stop:26666 length:1182 start_codon:yes stop_codon:yes gene_type:complete
MTRYIKILIPFIATVVAALIGHFDTPFSSMQQAFIVFGFAYLSYFSLQASAKDIVKPMAIFAFFVLAFFVPQATLLALAAFLFFLEKEFVGENILMLTLLALTVIFGQNIFIQNADLSFVFSLSAYIVYPVFLLISGRSFNSKDKCFFEFFICLLLFYSVLSYEFYTYAYAALFLIGLGFLNLGLKLFRFSALSGILACFLLSYPEWHLSYNLIFFLIDPSLSFLFILPLLLIFSLPSQGFLSGYYLYAGPLLMGGCFASLSERFKDRDFYWLLICSVPGLAFLSAKWETIFKELLSINYQDPKVYLFSAIFVMSVVIANVLKRKYKLPIIKARKFWLQVERTLSLRQISSIQDNMYTEMLTYKNRSVASGTTHLLFYLFLLLMIAGVFKWLS